MSSERKVLKRLLLSDTISDVFNGAISNTIARLTEIHSIVPVEYRDSMVIGCYEGDVDVDIYYMSPETDEEYARRMSSESSKEERERAQELALYKQLKEEFGDEV